MAIFGSFPLYFAEDIKISYLDSLFESISGLTTTGATVLGHEDTLIIENPQTEDVLEPGNLSLDNDISDKDDGFVPQEHLLTPKKFFELRRTTKKVYVFDLRNAEEFEKSHPEAGDNNYCMELETIAQGVVPNQYGTWGYGRAGWCPGMDVTPYIVNLTDYIEVGEENILDYDACRVSGGNCLSPPTCLGDGYCPEVAFSSYIIIWY